MRHSIVSFALALFVFLVDTVNAQGECLNCLNGQCSLEGQCQCNPGFERKNNDCKAVGDSTDDTSSAAGELLPGLPDAILFGLIAGGVLLLLIMLACCFYFIRSSFSDSAGGGLPASTSYRDNAMAARANTVAGQSAVFNSPANSGVFNPNLNSGVFFGGGGGGFGGGFQPQMQQQQQQPATLLPQRSQTFVAQKASPRGGDDVERDSVHRGYAFPGSMAASNVHEPELDLPDDDGEFDVNTEELVPQDAGGVYSSKPVVTKPPVKKASAKKPQFVCDDCGAEYYWETDLAAHQRKRH